MRGTGLARRLAWLAVVLLAAGCSRPTSVDIPLAPAEERLFKIGKAYMQANIRLQRGPKNFEEIKSDLDGEVPPDLLRSPRDNEELVILWGVHQAALPPQPHDPLTVGGYEKNGVDGKRYVLRFPIGVTLMTDEAFKAAVFPPGHKCPL